MTSNNALAPIAGTNGYQQQIAIDPNEPLHLSVSNANGRITVTGSDQPNVWVVVRRTDDRSEEEHEVGIEVLVDGNSIAVRPNWQIASGLQGLAKRVKDQLQHGFNPEDWNISKLQLHPDLEYDIRVEIPRSLKEGSRVYAKTATGRIEISGTYAQVSAASASGSVRLNDIDGKTSAHTASGSIHVTNATGSLEANTASGSIHINGGEAWTALRTVSGSIKMDAYTLKNARIVTVSGSVSGAITAPNAIDYSIETVSGSVKLDTSVPAAESTARLNFKTLSGSAKVDGDWIPEGKRSWRIGSGDDGPRFRVKTVSGSLKMTGTANADVSARTEPLPVQQPTPERIDGEPETATEPITLDQSDLDDTEQARNVSANLDLDLNLDKAFTWAKETARKFTPATPATPPTPTTPPTPSTPAAPVTPVTPSTPPTGPDWSWSSGAGSPPPPGTANPAANVASDDTAPAEPETANAAGAEPTATADTSSLDSVDAERLHILEALERGEIDVDEALATIEREESQQA